LPPRPAELRFGAVSGKLWTESKARLIERYISGFQLVTNHGTYIDGFAAPQESGQTESWAAKLVLDATPKRLRHFYLFDRPERAHYLEELRRKHPDRDVVVLPGDFNRRVHEILTPQIIGEKEATFCLLDQWSTECAWSTVRALARHKRGQHKIELFYFLAVGWLHRMFGGTTRSETLQKLETWYGGPDWEQLEQLNTEAVNDHFRRRFLRELGYRYVIPWAIFERDEESRIMYYMIHASDHPRAPKLMEDAYRRTVAWVPKPPRPFPGFGVEDGEGH
jgi:three-Cys-motif partner protein